MLKSPNTVTALMSLMSKEGYENISRIIKYR